MTLIVGWLACDQRGPCSAYIASDSRISDNRNFYDYSQKTFALKNTPDILGYCGETLFTYQILTRLTSMCDVGMLLSADMDYQDRSEIIFNEIKRAHSAYKLNNGMTIDNNLNIISIVTSKFKVELFDEDKYNYLLSMERIPRILGKINEGLGKLPNESVVKLYNKLRKMEEKYL